MTAQLLWGYVHILLLVFWLGADIGVFIAANIARTTTYSVDTRAALLSVAGIVDLFPRYCFALMLPSGLTLVDAAALYAPPLWALLLAWGVGGAWVLMIWLSHKNPAAGFVKPFGRVQFWGQAIYGAGLAAVAVASYISHKPIAEPWLASKVLILGVMCFVAMMLEVVSRPFGVAFGEIKTAGSTPEREARASAAMVRTLSVVLVIYVLLFLAAFIGKVKPF
jgi:hypothetical protein